MNGFGTFDFPDGSKYVGNYHDNVFQGDGEYTTHEKKIYSGGWDEGTLFSDGVDKDKWCTVIFPNGGIYKGGNLFLVKIT